MTKLHDSNYLSQSDGISRKLLLSLIVLSILTSVLLIVNVALSILTAINLPTSNLNECLQNDKNDLIYQQLFDLNQDDAIDFSTKTITYKQGEKVKLNGKFGNRINYADYKSVVSKNTKSNSRTIQFNALSRAANIQLKLNTYKQDDITCDNFNWNIININDPAPLEFDDCFSLDSASWYGGSEVSNQQYWPINNQDFGTYKPYISGIFAKSSAVLERYWFSTNGISIVADYNSPLFVLKNSTSLCLLGSSSQPFDQSQASKLNYTVCRIDTSTTLNYMNKLHLFVINNFLSKPSNIPDEKMFQRPIWSTWAVYKKFINEEKVEEFAKDILAHNYSNSQLEIGI